MLYSTKLLRIILKEIKEDEPYSYINSSPVHKRRLTTMQPKAQNVIASVLILLFSIGCSGSQKYKDWKQIEYRNCGGFEQRALGEIVDGESAVIKGKINLCSTGKPAGHAKLTFISMNGDTVKHIEADESGKFIDTISPDGFHGNVIVTGFASGLTMNNVYIEPSFNEYYFHIKLSQYPSYINEFEGSSEKETKKLRKEIEKLKR